MLLRRLAASLVLLASAAGARAESLSVGSRAPEFALQGSDGREHRLADHLGQRGVVLAWFPKAFTPG
jgi:peroxiredoxin Q/BCP